MNEKVAFFDFCETLVDFQTADAYVDFVRERTNNRRMVLLNNIQSLLTRIKVIKVLSVIFPTKSVNKRIKLFQLKGFSEEELKELASYYYLERIKPHFIQRLVETLIELKNDGYSVGLVSGGYGIYLQYFVEEYNLDFCVSSNISFRKGKCTGLLDGLDCLNNNKIILLKQYFKETPQDSIAFSDSVSDIPLLQYAKKGVVVSRQHQEWSNIFYNEIIW